MSFSFTWREIRTGIFFLILFCTNYILHNNIFDRDLIGPHTWRQSYTQQNIDCFYEEDNNILHPRILARGTGTGIIRQEFPIMQWTVAQSYYALGQSIRSTRIVCFLFGSCAIVGFFLLLLALTNRKSTVFAGTFLFAFSPLFFYYSMNPLPDLLALTFAVWSMYYYVRANREQKLWLFLVATSFLSLATLAKLPYILFSGIPIGYFIHYFQNKNKSGRNFLLWSALCMAPALLWYYKILPGMTGNATLRGIFSAEPVGDPILDAIIGNLTDSLPFLFLGYAALPLFLVGLFVLVRNRRSVFNKYLPFTLTGLLFLLYFIYESNLISTIHDYYMMPFLPLLFLIASLGFHFLFPMKIFRIASILLVLAAPFVANAVIQPRWNPGVTEYCHDLFQFRDELRMAVPDTAMVVMGNDYTMSIMPYYIDKKGWTYVDAELQRFNLECFIRDGATHLYTNSALTLQDTSLRTLIKREIGVYGTIHVFELVPKQVQ